MDVNSDRDSLPGVVEKFGLMFNGTPIETNIYKEDTDEDGLWDDEEVIFDREASIAGLEKGVCTEGITFFANPTKQHSDTDGIGDAEDSEPLTDFDNRFVIVDDIYYEPSIDFVDERYRASQNCYESKPTSKPVNELKLLLFYPISSIAGDFPIMSTAFSMLNDGAEVYGNMPHANEFMDHYLEGSGAELHLSSMDVVSAISTHNANVEHYIHNMSKLMKMAESALAPGATRTFSTVSDTELRATCYWDGKPDEKSNTNHCGVSHTGEMHYENASALDWGHSIGESFVSIVADVSCNKSTIIDIDENGWPATRDGVLYTMTFRYYVKDIYEWAYHYDNEMKILHDMHEAGVAQEYLVSGYFERTISWEKGKSSEEETKDMLLNILLEDGIIPW